MKTFLLVLGGVVLALIVLKLCPVVLIPLAVGLLLGLVGLVVVGALGLSLLAVAFGLAVVLAAVLSPIWIPVLLIAGLVWLVRRLGAKPAATAK
jgi:hypothetical protein